MQLFSDTWAVFESFRTTSDFLGRFLPILPIWTILGDFASSFSQFFRFFLDFFQYVSFHFYAYFGLAFVELPVSSPTCLGVGELSCRRSDWLPLPTTVVGFVGRAQSIKGRIPLSAG